MTITELAYAKVNLVLRVGSRLPDGMHPVCSLFASVALADRVRVVEADQDAVLCPGVDGMNLAAKAVATFRAAVPELPPLAVTIEKRIPVAAGLGGGSADAAAVLRAANELTGSPLSPDQLRALAAGIGSDVPSQVVPRHALVTGIGQHVDPIDLPPMALALLPAEEGLATPAAFAELDRLRVRDGAEPFAGRLDPEPVRRMAAMPLAELAARLDNDLEAAATSLRPELLDTVARVLAAGALAAQVTGSGPTVFGIFEDHDRAVTASAQLGGAIVTEVRSC